MDAKLYFRNCCKELNIDCDELFKVGAQNPKDKVQLQYSCQAYSRKESNIYAVCFFESVGLYVAWDLRVYKSKTHNKFNIKKEDVCKQFKGELTTVTKLTEYSGWGEEEVYVFSPEKVNDFLEMVKKELQIP